MNKLKKTKVLELIRTASGGMRQHYISLIKGLKNKGFDVLAVCSFDNFTMKELINQGIEVYPFALPGRIQPYKDVVRAIKIAHIIKERGVDVVHCHGFKAGIVGRVGAILAGCPKVYTVHNFVSPAANPVKRWAFKKVERILAKHTEGIIAVSRALKEEMERVCHIPFDRISVVYNGIPIPHSYDGDNTRQYLGIGRDTILVGTIARLIPSKGIQHLLDAIPLVMRSYKDIHFVVIGDGPYEEMLKKKAIELGIENITFVGYVNTVWGYLDAIDIFVLPTLSEGLGISILEAMAMGKPVIASRVGGIPEIINHDDNGYLISPGDSGALAFAILYLAANPQVRKDYGQRGCRDVRAHFSIEKMVDATAKILERCTHIKATPL